MQGPIGVNAVMLPELDLDEQISLCQELGVSHYQVRPRIVPQERRDKPYTNWGNHKFDLTPTRLRAEAAEIRRRLSDANMIAFGTVPSAIVTDAVENLMLDLEGASAVGAGRMRVASEPLPNGPFDYSAVLDKTIEGYRRVIELARPHGIKIVIETHANSLACSPALAWNICRHFSPGELGVIFDINNFNLEGNITPHLAVAVLRPYIDHVHVGGMMRTTVGKDERGFRTIETRSCLLDEADLHLPTWLNALCAAQVDVPLVIESYVSKMPGAERLRLAVDALRRATAA